MLDISNKKTIAILLGVSFNTCCLAQDNKAGSASFPIPAGNPKQLFYLQRNENINTVIYELKEEKGFLDPQDPVHAFWIMYTKKEQHEELSAMEKKFAYGIKIKSSDKDKCFFTLVAYPKITLQLAKDSVEKFRVYITPLKRKMILHRTFIKVKDGSFKLDPVVEYIEFSGIDVINGKAITERITP